MKPLFLILISAVTLNAAPGINALRLISGSNNQAANGASVPQNQPFYLRAKGNDQAASVVFFGVETRTVKPCVNTNCDSDQMSPVAGNYTITVTPWSRADGTGTSGPEVRATFTITGEATPAPTPETSPVPTPSPTATMTATATETPAPTATATATQTAAPTATATATATHTPTPAPTATSTPTQTATATPIATATRTPTSTPSATVTATATFTPTPAPTASATATATVQPTPSPTVSPPRLVTVTVNWIASVPTEYSIFYGKTPATDEMQVYGGRAWAAGPMCVAIANLQPNTKYYFSDTATWYEVTGPKLQPPVEYTTTAALNQQLNLP